MNGDQCLPGRESTAAPQEWLRALLQAVLPLVPAPTEGYSFGAELKGLVPTGLDTGLCEDKDQGCPELLAQATRRAEVPCAALGKAWEETTRGVVL